MQREPYPLPLIRAEDYEAIRGLHNADFPDTYDEWRKLFTKQKLERGQVGYDVREIQVNPDEFKRFCAARRIGTNGKSLLDFAAEKFAGNRY